MLLLFLDRIYDKTMKMINNTDFKNKDTMKTEETMKVNLTLDQDFYNQIKSLADSRYLKVATYIKQQLKFMLADNDVPVGTTDSEQSDDNLMCNPLTNEQC